VTLTTVRVVENKKHLVTKIVDDFSGRVNGFNAESAATNSLTAAGKNGSFVARNAKHLRIQSAVITPALDQVTLTPRMAIALSKPVVVINGQAPGGMQVLVGGFIDGNDEGHAGDDGEFVIARSGVTRD
jgi:hypothetical protein